MILGDVIVYFWLLPLTLEILLPLAILCGWAVIKLLSFFFGANKAPNSIYQTEVR